MSDPRRLAFLAVALVACAIGSARGASAGHAPARLAFPRDSRVHLAARDEWWSLHGDVRDSRGARFAFHTTFFRYGLGRGAALHAAFVTVLDERSGRTSSAMRAARTIDRDVRARGVRVDDWSLASTPLRDARAERIDVAIGDRTTRLTLAAYPLIAPVPSPAAAGYAIVRMRASGMLTANGRRVAVRGSAWLDHEYEAAGPSPQSVGRDRFELTFDDGRAVELVAPRVADGRYGPFGGSNGARERASQETGDGPSVPARGIVVERDGRARELAPDDTRLVVRGDTRWHSTHDGATYPALWELSLDGFPPLALAPLARDQEYVPQGGGVAAWLGAIDIAHAVLPGEHLGAGSVELTGYAPPLAP